MIIESQKKEEFDIEFEIFQFMNYYNKKNTHNKTNTFYCFQCSKRRKIIWSGQNWNRENKKRFYDDRPFKEGDKVHCSSRIKEAEGRTKLISSFFLNWKTKGTKYEKY